MINIHRHTAEVGNLFFKTTLCVQLGALSILAFSECIWGEAEYFFGLEKGVECADSHKDR